MIATDSCPLKFRIYFGRSVTCFGDVEVARVRVLESDGVGAHIIREDRQTMPEECGVHDLFDTAREAIDNKREFLRAMAAHMRRQADCVEAFLQLTETHE